MTHMFPNVQIYPIFLKVSLSVSKHNETVNTDYQYEHNIAYLTNCPAKSKHKISILDTPTCHWVLTMAWFRPMYSDISHISYHTPYFIKQIYTQATYIAKVHFMRQYSLYLLVHINDRITFMHEGKGFHHEINMDSMALGDLNEILD